MARIKIKHKVNLNDKQTKQKLLELLAKEGVNICNLIPTRDGSIVAVTATENDADLLLKTNMMKTLGNEGFEPILPPEVRARRTVICQGIDELIYDHSKADIEDEIEEKNTWATVKDSYKFPPSNRNTYLIKIEFEDASMAAKAEEHGLRLFNMSIAGHQIKREKYTQLKTCMRCYKIEDHTTAQCPKPHDYKVCSECASHEHTWRQCKSQKKRCINCEQEHRTLAMSCPKRKEAIKDKQNAQNTHGNYAQAASANSTNYLPGMNITNLTDKVTTMMFCLYNAHMMNAVQPGTFQQHLDLMTTSNKLPRLIGPSNPPSNEILHNILGNTIPMMQADYNQHTQTQHEDRRTECNPFNSDTTEETRHTEEDITEETRHTEEEVDETSDEDGEASYSPDHHIQMTQSTTKRTQKSTKSRTPKNINHNTKNIHQTKQKPSMHNLQRHTLQQNQDMPEQTKDPRDPRLRHRQH